MTTSPQHIEIGLLKAKEEMLQHLIDTRQAIGTEHQRLAQELRQLIDDSKSHKADLEREIALCKASVADHAIDKTMGIVRYVAGALAAVSIFIGLGSWLGFKDVRSLYQQEFRSELAKWLKFDREDSPSKQDLNQLRTHAMLDSYIVKLARQQSEAQRPSYRLELKPAENERLLQMLEHPDTSYGDFNDAMKVMRASRGAIMPYYPDDQTGKRLLKLVDNRDLSDEKKLALITIMGNDRIFEPYIKRILESDQASPSWQAALLPSVSVWDTSYAERYASNHVNAPGGEQYAATYAEWLARYAPASPALRTYFERLGADQKDGAYKAVDVMTAMLSGSDLTAGSWNPTKERAVAMLASLIDHGASFTVSDGPTERYLVLQLRRSSAGLKSIEPVFTDQKLLAELARRYETGKPALQRFVAAMQVADRGLALNAVLIHPAPGAVFRFADGSQLAGKECDTAWLQADQELGQEQLTVSWRAADGQVRKKVLANVDQLAGSRYEFSFSPGLLRKLTAPDRYLMESLI